MLLRPLAGAAAALVLLAIPFRLATAADPAPASATESGIPASEAERWLVGYLALDTTNPPGNEARAVGYLADILRREKIPFQTLVSPGGRASLYARLPANRRPVRPGLLLLHHTDVVAPGPGWSVEPFGGTLADGRLWGRGALDAKSLGIAHLAAFLEARRRDLPRDRDLAFLAVADEEAGGGEGTAWLLERHGELFSGIGAVFNEGGSNRMAQERLLWWGVEVAQKRPLWLAVRARGRGGHGSGLNPGSAPHELIAGLSRLLELPPRYRVTAAVRRYFEALAPLHNEHWRAIFLDLDRAIAPEGPTVGLLPGMANWFLDTVQVTVLDAGEQINVIPETATARIDARLLPDSDAEAFLARLREALGPRLEIEILLTAPPAPPSPTDNVFYRAIEAMLGREGPVVPAFIPGFTDSRYFRARGIAAYGLSPFALQGSELRGIHGPDERIPVDEFQAGVARTIRVVSRAISPAP